MGTVRVEVIARALNRSPRFVQKLVHEGMPKSERGQYDLAVCMMWYIRREHGRLRAAGVDPNDSAEMRAAKGLRVQRERLVRAQADREELELGRALGAMLVASEVQTGWLEKLGVLRERILGLPSRIAHQVEGRGRDEIQERLTAASEDALRSIEESTRKGH